MALILKQGTTLTQKMVRDTLVLEIHYWSMKRPFYYGGNEKWKELNDYFIRHQLNGEWPPFNGFIESHKVTLKKGVVLDRYDYNGASQLDGIHRGRFASPKMSDGTRIPFQNRALRGNESNYVEFYELVVLEDFSVEMGPAIPWFNQPGKGIQILFPKDIEELIREGKMKIINLVRRNDSSYDK